MYNARTKEKSDGSAHDQERGKRHLRLETFLLEQDKHNSYNRSKTERKKQGHEDRGPPQKQPKQECEFYVSKSHPSTTRNSMNSPKECSSTKRRVYSIQYFVFSIEIKKDTRY